MNLHHYVMLIIVLIAGYWIGTHYKMNLPLLG